MKCGKCEDTGIVSVFSDDWPTNCNCVKGSVLEIASLERKNKKLWSEFQSNVDKINKLHREVT